MATKYVISVNVNGFLAYEAMLGHSRSDYRYCLYYRAKDDATAETRRIYGYFGEILNEFLHLDRGGYFVITGVNRVAHFPRHQSRPLEVIPDDPADRQEHHINKLSASGYFQKAGW